MKKDDHIRRKEVASVQPSRRILGSRRISSDDHSQLVNLLESKLSRLDNIGVASQGRKLHQFHRLFDVGNFKPGNS